jgi:hypothetical protein
VKDSSQFLGCVLLVTWLAGEAAGQGTSLRIVNDRNLNPALIQRVRIAIGGYGLGADLHPPMDLGDPLNAANGSFTIEFWIRGTQAENSLGQTGCDASAVNWIYCPILLDRDVNDIPSFGEFGMSVCSDGAVRAGVINSAWGVSACHATAGALDAAWHHLALTRNGSTGLVCLFVDGVQGQCATGPTSPLSFDDRSAMQSPSGQDPTLVFGAEKHGFAGPFPGFVGWLDEARFSSVVRYPACGNGLSCFARPTSPFSADPDTLGLYHFDDGMPGQPCSCAGSLDPLIQGACLYDASGRGTNAECRFGGTAGRFGPRFSAYTPFGGPDSDGDGVANVSDRCPFLATAGQADTGGYQTTLADGIGDLCQCGDTDDDYAVYPALDAVRLRNSLAGLAPGVADPARCSVIGGPYDCDLRDLVVLRRAAATPTPLAPGIAQVCDAALP